MSGIFGLITGICIGYIIENKNYKKLKERIDFIENSCGIDKTFWGDNK